MKEIEHKFKQQRAVSIREIKAAFVKKYNVLQSRKLEISLGASLITSTVFTAFIGYSLEWSALYQQDDSAIMSIMSMFRGFFQTVIITAIALGAIWVSYSMMREMLILENIDFKKRAVDFELKIIPARTALEKINVFSMFGEISKTPILYKIIETGQYTLKPRMFAQDAMLRFATQAFFALFIGMAGLIILPVVRGADVAIYLMLTVFLWLTTEFVHALLSLFATRTKLKSIVKKDPVGACGELNISIKPHSFLDTNTRKINALRDRAKDSGSLDINAFERLLESAKDSEHFKMVVIRLEWLAVELLKAFSESNKNDSAKMSQYRNIHLKNTQKMQMILEVFIPACLQELSLAMARNNSSYSFDNITIEHESVITKKKISETDLIVLMKIDKEAAKQGLLIESITKQYQDMSENSISSGFMQIINNQQKGWLDYDERGFSPKIQILETNLHRSIIPEIEAMMVGATPEQQEILKDKRIEVEGIIDELAQKDINGH